MWVDKYAPKRREDIVGCRSTFDTLLAWLKGFTSQTKPRAALLFGPPGIGKTTIARLAATLTGFEIVELNASDSRNVKAIQDALGGSMQKSTVDFSAPAKKQTPRKRMVLLEEIDGMSTSDRGGSGEMMKFIETSEVPVICTCNDAFKVKTLAKRCLELKMIRPPWTSVVARLKDVCRLEGFAIAESKLKSMVEASGNDIRQCINQLEFMALGTSQAKGEKDENLRLNFMGASTKIFSNLGLDERMEAFYADFSLVPMSVAEHYIRASPDDMQILSRAADAVCDMDFVDKKIHADQEWKMLPCYGALTVRVASIAKGRTTITSFPEWFGKNSSAQARDRKLMELGGRMRASGQVGLATDSTIRQQYVPALQTIMFGMLSSENPGSAAELATEYYLSRDEVFESLGALGCDPDKLVTVAAQSKAAFTRELGKRRDPMGDHEAPRKSVRFAQAEEEEEEEVEETEEQLKEKFKPKKRLASARKPSKKSKTQSK